MPLWPWAMAKMSTDAGPADKFLNSSLVRVMVVSQASSSSSSEAAATELEAAEAAADVTFTGEDEMLTGADETGAVVMAGAAEVTFEEGDEAPVPVLAAEEPLP